MKTINHTINGLASSLFLNVGFTRVAEMFDPMQKQNGKSIMKMEAGVGSETCVPCLPCNFTPEAGW